MTEMHSDSQSGYSTRLVDHFFRVVRHNSGSQPVMRELADLKELRAELEVFFAGLEPGEVQIRPNAVTLTGEQGGVDALVTVQLWVAQPSSPWAEAAGGPYGDWSGWIATLAKERGWWESRKPA